MLFQVLILLVKLGYFEVYWEGGEGGLGITEGRGRRLLINPRRRCVFRTLNEESYFMTLLEYIREFPS